MPSSIKLFLQHDDPIRLRNAQISNWSGMSLAAPRTELDDLLKKEEMGKCGIYVLIGSDPETESPMAYIGEAEVLSDRLKNHRANKEFWVSVITFFGKDENLTKAHIRFLEGHLIQEAKAAGRYVLDNNSASNSHLPESDRYEMITFLENIRLLLPILGSDLLKPMNALPPLIESENDKLRTEIKGLMATGQRTPSGFVVFKGSNVRPDLRRTTQQYSPAIITTREKLLKDGTLKEENDHLVFTRDFEFSSPSSAASIIHGGNVNGLNLWKDKNGRTLKELDEK